MSKRSTPGPAPGSGVAISVRAPVRVDRAEHRVAVVRGLLVGEVDPGHDPFQQAAGEHRHVQVRGLRPAVGQRHRARLDGDDPVPAGQVRGRPAEPAEPVRPRRARAARVVRVRERPVRRRLPGLHQGVRHRVAGAVEDPAGDRDRARGTLGDHERAVRPGQPEGQERADGLGRGLLETVLLRPWAGGAVTGGPPGARTRSRRGRAARCPTGSRGPSRARSPPGQSGRSWPGGRAGRGPS